MKLRFALLERPAGLRRFSRVAVPGLGRWHKSDEGVRAYGYSQEVRGLHDGSTYRMRVGFRWYGAGHRLLRRARRVSRACRMFVPLPDLKVGLLGHRPTTHPGVWSYGVRVIDAGQLGADDVAVQLSVDGSVVDTKTIFHLDPGEAKTRYFSGPVCTAGYAAVADPENTVAESNEGDNSASASCLG
jgi:hypothetical protein